MNIRDIARQHTLHYNRPAATFFEGALLGNGGLGAVVTTRPDAVVIHLGHNNVWDIRIAENHKDSIGTFESLFARIKQIPEDRASLSDDPWYRELHIVAYVLSEKGPLVRIRTKRAFPS